MTLSSFLLSAPGGVSSVCLVWTVGPLRCCSWVDLLIPNCLSLSPLSPSLCSLLPPSSTYLSHRTADKVNDDFYSKRRHLAELAAKGNLPLHPVRVEDEPRAFSPEHGPAKQNGQKSRTNKTPSHPLAYNSTANFKSWDPKDQSLRRQQAYGNKGKLGTAESSSSDPLGTRTQHYPPPQPYFITNSKTEVTVWAVATGDILETTLNWERQKIPQHTPSLSLARTPTHTFTLHTDRRQTYWWHGITLFLCHA